MKFLPTVSLAGALLGCATVDLPGREVRLHIPAELKVLLKTLQPGDTLLLADGSWTNAVIVSRHGPLVRLEDPPVRTRWLANVAHGTHLGVPGSEGLRQLDPQLEQGADELWRPSGQSPARGAAQGDFADVTEDIEGRARGERKDMGCFQLGPGEVRHGPLTRKQAGPDWR